MLFHHLVSENPSTVFPKANEKLFPEFLEHYGQLILVYNEGKSSAWIFVRSFIPNFGNGISQHSIIAQAFANASASALDPYRIWVLQYLGLSNRRRRSSASVSVLSSQARIIASSHCFAVYTDLPGKVEVTSGRRNHWSDEIFNQS